MLWASLKKLVPRKWKQRAKAAIQAYRMERALQKIMRLPPGVTPSAALIEELAIGWGNEGFAAPREYLLEICKRAVNTKGPILECGSGLTTLLLGLLAARRGVPVWSLEHIPEWAGRSIRVFERHQIPNVHLCVAPLRDYGEFAWYDPPQEFPLQFSLVICDGPPGTVRGGRYGLLPVLGERLMEGAAILLDDTARPGEQEIIRRWAEEFRASAEVPDRLDRSFAILTYTSAPRPDSSGAQL